CWTSEAYEFEPRFPATYCADIGPCPNVPPNRSITHFTPSPSNSAPLRVPLPRGGRATSPRRHPWPPSPGRLRPGLPLHPAARALVKATVPLEDVAREVGRPGWARDRRAG